MVQQCHLIFLEAIIINYIIILFNVVIYERIFSLHFLDFVAQF